MITEDYCSYKVAKLLKEKGFNESCTELNKLCLRDGEKPVLKVTHQKAMKWLREEHNILTVVSITYEKERYDWYICGIKGNPWEKKLFYEEKDITYNTYEEAVEAALKYCLEHLIK